MDSKDELYELLEEVSTLKRALGSMRAGLTRVEKQVQALIEDAEAARTGELDLQDESPEPTESDKGQATSVEVVFSTICELVAEEGAATRNKVVERCAKAGLEEDTVIALIQELQQDGLVGDLKSRKKRRRS